MNSERSDPRVSGLHSQLGLSLRPPTPPLDPLVADLASRTGSVDRANKETKEAGEDSEDSDSDLFAELEKDDDVMLAGMREKRLEALKAE